MNTIILDTFMRHLDAFPTLTRDDRTAIFEAFEKAPEEPFSSDDHAAWEAWKLAREIPLTHTRLGGGWYALTLDEVTGGASAPTKKEILTVLDWAAERAREYAA